MDPVLNGPENAEFERHCNVSYAQCGIEIIIKAKSNLCLCPPLTMPIELFGNNGSGYLYFSSSASCMWRMQSDTMASENATDQCLGNLPVS